MYFDQGCLKKPFHHLIVSEEKKNIEKRSLYSPVEEKRGLSQEALLRGVGGGWGGMGGGVGAW